MNQIVRRGGSYVRELQLEFRAILAPLMGGVCVPRIDRLNSDTNRTHATGLGALSPEQTSHAAPAWGSGMAGARSSGLARTLTNHPPSTYVPPDGPRSWP